MQIFEEKGENNKKKARKNTIKNTKKTAGERKLLSKQK